MEIKKIIALVTAGIIVIALALFGFPAMNEKPDVVPIVNEKSEDAFKSFTEMEALSPADEVTMQSQLTEIISKEREEGCDTLLDPRYRYACHDLFKNMKK